MIKTMLPTINELLQKLVKLKTDYERLAIGETVDLLGLNELLHKLTLLFTDVSITRARLKNEHENTKLLADIDLEEKKVAYRKQELPLAECASRAKLDNRGLRETEIEALKWARYADDIKESIKEMIHSTKKRISELQVEQVNQNNIQ